MSLSPYVKPPITPTKLPEHPPPARASGKASRNMSTSPAQRPYKVSHHGRGKSFSGPYPIHQESLRVLEPSSGSPSRECPKALRPFDPLFANSGPMASVLPPPPPLDVDPKVSASLQELARDMSNFLPVRKPQPQVVDAGEMGGGHKRYHSYDSGRPPNVRPFAALSVVKSGSDGSDGSLDKPVLRKYATTGDRGDTMTSRVDVMAPPPMVNRTLSAPCNSVPAKKIGEEIVLRSTELDPSLHQVEIPSPDSLLTHARVCAVMEEYRVVDQNFDFRTLTGLGRLGMNGTSNLVGLQRPIVTSVAECADDLVVEGFFSSKGTTCHDRVEVAVFHSHKNREFVVCWRGRTKSQIKPVRNRDIRAMHNEGKPQTTLLHADQPIPIFSNFREDYFVDDLEGKVFRLLGILVEDHPFCDLITTGHSFGGALATICAIRYATAFPMMRVACHVFGCPRVGAKSFKQLAHSLPNLKVVRIENAKDPHLDASGQHLVHVGHTIRIPDNKSNKSPLAYKFDKHSPGFSSKMFALSKTKKADHEIRAYVHAIERFTHRGMPWVKGYVGEMGKGVKASQGEVRNLS